MSDFPEKEQQDNLHKTAVQNEQPKAEEQSTIFAKHVYNTKKPAKKGDLKRLLICVIAAVLCAVIIVAIPTFKGWFGVSDSSDTMSVPEKDKISVLKYKDIVKPSTVQMGGEQVRVDTNISEIHVVNFSGEFTIKNEFVEANKGNSTSSAASMTSTAASSGTSSAEEAFAYETKWYVEEIDKSKTDSDAIFSSVKGFLDVSAIREMKNTFASVEEYHEYYGLNESLNAGIVIIFNDGTKNLLLTLGTRLPTGDYYFLSSLSDTVYVITAEDAEKFACSTKSYADSTIIEPIVKSEVDSKYYTGDTLSRFDKIKLSGTVFGGKTYEFGLSVGASADYMPYRMTVPYVRPADDAFIVNFLDFASKGLEASVLYSYSVTKEDREQCGLDNPACIIELYIDDYKYKLIIGGSRNDGTESFTAMVEGKEQVFGIEEEKLAFLIAASNDITTMFHQKFIMEDIYTLKGFKMQTADGSYDFKLTHIEREGDKNVIDTTVKLNSLTMNTASFKRLYQRVLMLSLLDYVLEAKYAKPVLSVTFDYLEGGLAKKVEFTESADDMYHYTAWVDSVPLGKVLKSSVNDILNNLDIYLNGGEVPDIW